jgi:hypothetical protein
MQLVKEEIVSEFEKEAYMDWVNLNAKTGLEVFLGIGCSNYLGAKNLDLDLHSINFAWFQFQEKDYLNSKRSDEEREQLLAAVENEMRTGDYPKCIKKHLVKAVKQLQKKGVIEVLSSKSWHEYKVNIHNPLLKQEAKKS